MLRECPGSLRFPPGPDCLEQMPCRITFLVRGCRLPGIVDSLREGSLGRHLSHRELESFRMYRQ